MIYLCIKEKSISLKIINKTNNDSQDIRVKKGITFKEIFRKKTSLNVPNTFQTWFYACSYNYKTVINKIKINLEKKIVDYPIINHQSIYFAKKMSHF